MSFQLQLILIIVSLSKAGSTVKYNLFNRCKCSQLKYQDECNSLYQYCNYKDGICKEIPCSEQVIETFCKANLKCGWLDQKCIDFVSCSKYGSLTESGCKNLHPECAYNPYTLKCDRYDKAFTKTCSETSQNQCYMGADGVCEYSNDKCSLLTSCESVSYLSYGCFAASPYCYPNSKTQLCESQIECKNALRNKCEYAPDGINSHDYYLCQKAKDGSCEDFDLSIQTVDTCIQQSLGYYHWTGAACESCGDDKPGPDPDVNFQHVLHIVGIVLLVIQ